MFESPAELLKTSPQLCPTPIDRGFYEELTSRLFEAGFAAKHELDDFSGLAVEVSGGSAVSVLLREGPQIVNVFAFNAADPDERIWHESVIREGVFLRKHTRVWGTMARYRPLLAVLDDTVTADPGLPAGQHHPHYGGSGTPADWRHAGGAEGVRTTWEQFAGLLGARDHAVEILNENLCLFQKSIIDADRQRIHILPSDAVAGDRISLFAEIDLCVLVALSPYVDGARPASEPGTPEPRGVEVQVTEKLADPLPWPYPGISYPDMSRYLDESGTRSTEPVVTPGIDYQLTGR
jgi:uncharacterized protein YcgI (DUF1989 family)